MSSHLGIRSVIVALAVAGLSLFVTADAQAGDKDTKAKIAVFTHSGGFKHGCLAHAESVIKAIGGKSGAFEATLLEGYKLKPQEIDLSFVTGEWLAQYDGILFFTTTGPEEIESRLLNSDQKGAFLDFVNGGKAFIGVHCASDTFYHWPEYGELVGAYFNTHGPNHVPATLKVEDTEHPATRMLGQEWVIADEFYQFRDEPYSRDKLHVLLSIDVEKTDMKMQGKQTRKDNDYALAWCKNTGKGRMFYTALGHRDDVWENEKFQAHLLGGIQWALGQLPGDATPSGSK